MIMVTKFFTILLALQVYAVSAFLALRPSVVSVQRRSARVGAVGHSPFERFHCGWTPSTSVTKSGLKMKGGGDDDDGWGSSLTPEAVTGKDKEILAKEDSPSDLQQPQEDRDLFIPIFSLVAIAGFIGAYAYETYRLYVGGQLYLPFLH